MKPSLTAARILPLLKATFRDWQDHNALRLSAALAYYSIFSIAPLLVIAISVSGLVLGDEAVRGHLEEQLTQYIGAPAAAGVQSMVKGASSPTKGWIGTVVGFFVLLLGAAGVFGQLKDALNTIWEVKPKGGAGVRGFIRERIVCFGMVLVIGFLVLTSLLMTTALAALNGYIERLMGVPPFVGGLLAFFLSFAVITTLFAFIFKVLPDARTEWRHVWIGAAATALLFELGKFGLSFYLGRAGTASGFGAAGSLVLILLWVYYASCILLFGAEFTQVVAQESGYEILPAAGAVSTRPLKSLGVANPVLEELLPVQVQTIEVVVRPGDRYHPLGALLAVTAASFVIGLLAKRHSEKV